MVAKSPPDGSTLFLTTMGAWHVTPHMRTDVRYDTIKDFAPITQVVLNTTPIVVRAEFAVQLGQGPDQPRPRPSPAS